jgi:hypothetical protein
MKLIAALKSRLLACYIKPYQGVLKFDGATDSVKLYYFSRV